MRLLCLLLLAVVALRASEAQKVSCKDEDGQDVDWWYMNLMSRYRGERKYQYLYVTSEDYGDWKMSEHVMGDPKSLTTQTLDPLYSNIDDILLAAYNDEFPNGTSFDVGGAAKGVIASDGETGMWLVHSIPQFPTMLDRSHPIPDTDGHSLLCLTLDGEGVKKVGDLLVLLEPHFYFKHNPLGMYRFPNLQRALYQMWHTDEIYEKDVELRTLDGEKFRLFGRSDKSHKELYSEIVAPALDVNLFVKSNRHSEPNNNLPNVCYNSNKVYNINDIVMPWWLLHKFTTTWEDHSKWAVAEEDGFNLFGWHIWGSNWICVGDLFRWRSHLNRGGGAVCQKSSGVSDRYRKLVHTYDKCN
ncbi:hypothetical protein ACLKA7_010273 [Drosophila subpalustris]